jgi:hypothetical protein
MEIKMGVKLHQRFVNSQNLQVFGEFTMLRLFPRPKLDFQILMLGCALMVATLFPARATKTAQLDEHQKEFPMIFLDEQDLIDAEGIHLGNATDQAKSYFNKRLGVGNVRYWWDGWGFTTTMARSWPMTLTFWADV